MAAEPEPSPSAVLLPHLDAACNLARWIMGGVEDAEDVVQEAMVRALTYFPSFRKGSARAWLLQIVRNTAYSVLRTRRGVRLVPLAEETGEDDDPGVALIDPGDDPEVALIRVRDRELLDTLIERLPLGLRETLVMRELEELSYREIAEITDVPIGTVMSRLWRARRLLAGAIGGEAR
ncbi:MAG: sigma-70 family RNA polymerase sigma factor [Stellaceae bacterium]